MQKKRTIDFKVEVGDICSYLVHSRRHNGKKVHRNIVPVTAELFCIVPPGESAWAEIAKKLGRRDFTFGFRKRADYPWTTYVFAVPTSRRGYFKYDRPRVWDILRVEKKRKAKPSQLDLFESGVGPAGEPAPSFAVADDDMKMPPDKKGAGPAPDPTPAPDPAPDPAADAAASAANQGEKDGLKEAIRILGAAAIQIESSGCFNGIVITIVKAPSGGRSVLINGEAYVCKMVKVGIRTGIEVTTIMVKKAFGQ